jgi:micrococcal nuclease
MIANVQLVSNVVVWLEKDVSDTDIYGRLLRYVWTEGGQVNAELVASGYTQVVTYPPDVKYQDDYLEFQRQARQASLGLRVSNQQLEKNKDAFYIACIKSEKYHYHTCKYADQIHLENLITFSSAPKARARGYVP